MRTGIIILAAGSSSRLGSPKQLLHHNGKLLIDIVCEAAIQSNFLPIIVVLGAKSSRLIEKIRLNYVINDSWAEGISSSIAAGLSAILTTDPDLENVILSVSDQPHITADIFEALFERKKTTGKGIIACRYAGVSGTPVLFDKKYFPALLALRGDSGAKPILSENTADMETIDFLMGYLDIDTLADYKKLIQE